MAVPAFGQQLGMDQDGSLTCDAGEMGVLNAVAGQQYNIDVIVENLANSALSFGVVFGTPDASAVSGVSFLFDASLSGAGWTTTPLATAQDNELTAGFLAYRTASGQAWTTAITDFNLSNPQTPSVIGTLTFTAEVTGCISFGIDAGDPNLALGSAILLSDFSQPQLTACAPNVCAGGDPLAIDDTDPTCPIPNAKNGEQYAGATFLATGGIPPYSWSQTGLPQGLDINALTGTVEGTPNDAFGNYPFTVTVMDSEGNTKASEQRSCSITLDPEDLAVNTGAPTCPLPNGKVGEFYDGPAFTATGGFPPYTWDVSSGNLFPGLAIGGATGKITGTPTVFGSRTLTIRVTDDQQNTATRSCQLTIDPADLAIDDNQDCPIKAEINQPMTPTTFTATGGVPPYTWDAAPLPNGVVVNQNTGEISGTPEEAGEFPIQVTVFDSDNPTNQTTVGCTLTVNVPALVIDSQDPVCPLPDGDVNQEYLPTLKSGIGSGIIFSATGGIPPYSWSQNGLPQGMDIDGTTGEINGTPTQSGGFAFTVFVDDSEGGGGGKTQASRSCSLFVNAADGGVDVGDDDKQTGAPGDTVYFDFIVESFSGSATEYSMSAFTSNGFGTVITGGNTLNLGPFGNQSVEVCVAIPGGVSCDDASDIVTLVVTRADDDNISDQGTAQLNVEFAKGVQVLAVLNGTCTDPGSIKSDFFKVHNTGDCEQTYDLSSSNSENWPQDAPKSVTIPGGDSTTVQIDVTVPQDALCTDESTLRLTATCTTDDKVTSTDSIGVFVCEVVAVDVKGPANQNAAAGDTVEYCFTVENLGNCDAFYEISTEAGQWELIGEAADPLKATIFIEIPPFGDTTVCVQHVVPDDAQENDDDSFCLVADNVRQTAKGIVTDSACVTTTVSGAPCVADFSLEFLGYTNGPEEELKGGFPTFDPGETFGMVFSLTNNSDIPDSYDISYDTELGWDVVLPFEVTQKFTGKLQIEILVTVPDDAECTQGIQPKAAGIPNLETVTLAAQSRNCDTREVRMASADAGVNAICDFDIEFLTADQIGAPGDTLYYDVEVTNNGNCNFDLIGQVFSVWDIDFGDVVVLKSGEAGEDGIPPGGSEVFTFGHIIPKTAVNGDEDKLEVCVSCLFDDDLDSQGPDEPVPGDFDVCDDVTSRVSTSQDCAQNQPVLQLGGFQTISYDGRFWEVQVAMINNGPGEARDINAMMDSDIEWLIITDADCAYGDLPQGGSSFGGADTYTFDLLNYPGGSFNVWFDVSYTDTCEGQYTVRLDPEFEDPNIGRETTVPSRIALHQNVPNPFNPLTKITIDLPVAGRTQLVIYNAAGQQIKTLVNEHLSAGQHSFEWRGKDNRGKDMPSGTYFYSLTADGQAGETRRMVLVR